MNQLKIILYTAVTRRKTAEINELVPTFEVIGEQEADMSILLEKRKMYE